MDILGLIALARSKGSGSDSGTFMPSFGTLATIQTGVSWFGDDPYTLTVLVSGYTVTSNTMISILPSADVIEQMITDGVTNIFITNSNGTLTATAVGGAPTTAMTLSVLCSESDQTESISALPGIVGDGVLETLQATDLTDAINQLSSDLDDAKNAIEQKATVIINTASGGIASFADGADGMMVKSLVVNIDHVQDLHGYDYPWAGGKGKNLFDGNYVGQYLSLNSGYATGKVYNDSAQMMAIVPITGGETYAVSRSGGNRFRIGESDHIPTNGETVDILDYRGDGFTTAVVTPSENAQYLLVHVSSTQTTVQLQVEKGTTVTPWTPYENICPISGWTDLTLDHNNEQSTVSWQSIAGTIFDGAYEAITGTLTNTHGEIESYNGETLPSTWISDRDVYAAGTTPTIGAQVVYELAAPIVYQIDPITVTTLLGNNTIYADCGSVDIAYPADTTLELDKYVKKDSIAESGIDLRFIGGAIRKASADSDWAFISDSAHTPLNLTSIRATAGGDIEITYGFTAKKVISLIVGCDETFANRYTVGASVGLDKSYITVYSLETRQKVDASTVYDSSGNFWIYGVMSV